MIIVNEKDAKAYAAIDDTRLSRGAVVAALLLALIFAGLASLDGGVLVDPRVNLFAGLFWAFVLVFWVTVVGHLFFAYRQQKLVEAGRLVDLKPGSVSDDTIAAYRKILAEANYTPQAGEAHDALTRLEIAAKNAANRARLKSYEDWTAILVAQYTAQAEPADA